MPRTILCVFVLAASFGADCPAASEIAPGVDLLPGAFIPGSQPDGNTVVLRGSDGLVVIDTGRHADHTAAIVEFAHSVNMPVRVVVNTHWHLDHVGGNPRLRAAFPGLLVVSSDAIEGALRGFLADYRRQLEEMVSSAATPEAAQPFRNELAILDDGPALLPDDFVSASSRRTLAGREVDLHLESHAVTAGDLWLLDPATRVLVAGDLVTLPAPFFDTACPARWQEALARLAAINFTTLVPGHGAPMDRPAFDTYRAAFDGLLDCAATQRTPSECAEGWLSAAGGLIPEADRRLARGLAGYYVEQSLRAAPAKVGALCGEPMATETH